jgi:hypothetical protein
MILNSAPQDQAIVSNVGQIGEFRIRNSAKAFSILSSGLYANKVRAIIRELSCNAIDSHTAAGNKNTPFDVHLPNQLEPWFSIRDYGTGLSHDQVTNIYTTYFESTKTASNEFIGALGLGSKSPFSYTDNFTVTAIKDGIKGVYTAFINEQGVPSIAKMMEEESTDPAGVEVKFSVNDRYDFSKFRDEARSVYKYFKQRPVVSGVTDFEFIDPSYKDMNIIPGVHSLDNGRSVAIMGNIAYPIEIPSTDASLGDLRKLLACGLAMEFGIGELDFQASREGLSYVPMTIESIKAKLEALNAQLAIHIATEANKIDNLWERAYYLYDQVRSDLWTNAVLKYVADTKFELFAASQWAREHKFVVSEKKLQSWNMTIRSFTKSRSYQACTNNKMSAKTDTSNPTTPIVTHYWDITISKGTQFIVNDTTVGATERAKFHYRSLKDKDAPHNVCAYVIEPINRKLPANSKAFFAMLKNPPEAQISLASTLSQKERANNMGKNVTILKLEERSRGYRNNTTMVWADAGKADSFDDTVDYYYLPLSGFQSLGKVGDVKELHSHLNRSGVHTGTIYGVRKSDMEYIKTQKNWVNIDEMITDKLGKMNSANVMGLVKQAVDIEEFFKYNVFSLINTNSPLFKLLATFKDVKAVDQRKQNSLEYLCRVYDVVTKTASPQTLIDQYRKEAKEVKERYPLLSSVSHYSVNPAHVAEYINLIDQTKGV